MASRTRTLDDFSDAEMLRVADVAEVLKVSRDKAYELVNSGAIPSVRLGEKLIRVPAFGLRQWISRQAGTPAPANGRQEH